MGVEKILAIIIGVVFQGIATATTLKVQIPSMTKTNFSKLSILLSIYGGLSFILIDNQIRFITTFIFIAFLIYYILKIKKKELVLYSFNSVMLLSFSEIIVTLILVVIGFDSKDIVNNYILNSVANLLIALVTIFIARLKPLVKIINKFNSLFINNRKLMNYLYIFIIILYMIVSKNGLELVLKSNYYLNILFILGIVLILTILIKNEFKSEQLKEQNQQMLNYVTKYEKIITEQGKANHEFKNQLMVIRGYAQMSSPKLLEYLDSIMEDFNKTSSSYLISQLNKFPDGGIKGLLYYKLSIIEDEKIKYDISVESGIKSRLNHLPINDYKNITKILGVLLDNAIDASKQTKDKKIIISVYKEKNNVIFKICNTYKGKLDISKIGSGYTTKGTGHGYGLKLVKDIIDNNSIYKLENMLEDEYYVSILKIDVKNKKK